MKGKRFVKAVAKFLLQGIAFTWLLFWYLSGSFWGLPQYIFSYYVASQVFMTPMSKAELFQGSISGMISSLGEKHSLFLNAEAYQNLLDQTSASYTGVGMVLAKDPKGVRVVSVIEGSPAAQAGMQAGDIITAIDGESTKDMAIDTGSSKVRGPAGSTVNLTVDSQGETKEVSITRQHITLPTVQQKMLKHHIGYIRLLQFSEKSADEFAKAYQDLQQQGATSLILDLRDNPGGLITVAQDIGSYIMPTGPIVTVQDRTGVVESYDSDGRGDNLPLVVLINGNSASASEIIAGAVQDRHAGIIVGTKSYGKGTVQTVLPGFYHTGYKVTIAKYHTPDGRVIDGTGITPDVIVPLDNNEPPTDHDAQVKRAEAILLQQ